MKKYLKRYFNINLLNIKQIKNITLKLFKYNIE